MTETFKINAFRNTKREHFCLSMELYEKKFIGVPIYGTLSHLVFSEMKSKYFL